MENITEGYEEDQPLDKVYEGHVVHILTPWGQVVATYFSEEQWDMLKTVSEMSTQDFEDVVCQTVAERYKLNKDN